MLKSGQEENASQSNPAKSEHQIGHEGNILSSKTTQQEENPPQNDDVECDVHKWRQTHRWKLVKFGAFYFFSGGPLMLISYISVYYRQLGLNPQQIGIVQSLQPSILIPILPLWGYLTDRLRVTRQILILSEIAYLVGYLTLAYTPRVGKVDCSVVFSRICDSDDINGETNETASAELYNSTWIDLHCDLSDKNTSFLYNHDDLLRLFIYIMAVNVLGIIFYAPGSALSNAAVLNCLGSEFRNRYGYFKAAWSIAAAIGILVAGVLVNQTQTTVSYCGIEMKHVSYNACFIGFTICMVIVIAIACTLSVPKQTPSKIKNSGLLPVFRALCSIRYGSAFLAVTWLAITIGVAKTFDFWYIEAAGGSHSIMAWTGMFGTLVQVVALFGLPVLNDKLGHLSFLTLALFLTGVGCATTAFITNPWWMIIPLCFRGLARGITTQSAGAYLANAVDKNHMATLQGIVGATVNGVGNGVGSLLGGTLINWWSPFVCYFTFAVMSWLFSALLLVSWCCDIRADESHEQEMREPEGITNEGCTTE